MYKNKRNAKKDYFKNLFFKGYWKINNNDNNYKANVINRNFF